jgi:hypothetical protein
MKSLCTIVLLCVVVLTGIPVCMAASAEHVGIVKSLAGEVVIVREGKPLTATAKMKVMKGDVVTTGSDGKAGLIFEDDTVISMGSNSRIAIENFLFQPSEKKLSFIARIYQGTASFLSGQIAKLAPNQVHVETPDATVGTRGTHFLVKVDR